ncbi:MAG: hypothetical protein ABR499_18710 [Gemmatimonadaceae bacterium]
MAKYTRHLGAAAVLSAALTFAACDRGSGGGADSPLGQDSALNRDLLLAGRDSAAQPQLQDVPAETTTTAAASPAPRATTPARRPTTSGARPVTRNPAPRTPSTPVRTSSGNTVTRGGSGGGGAVGTIPAGSTLSLTSNQRVCTNTHKEGDRFTARVTSPVSGSNGAVIPAGATVSLTVTRAKRSENANDPIVLEFQVNSITIEGKSYPVEASVASADVQRVRNQPKNKDVQKVVGGAVAGAIIGQVLGKNTKSTVIGAAAGGAAGAAAAAATANFEGCVEDGGAIRITLQDAVQVRA